MTQASVYWKELLFEKQHAVFIITKWPTGRYPRQTLMPEASKAPIRNL
jgi:hypothetical protein